MSEPLDDNTFAIPATECLLPADINEKLASLDDEEYEAEMAMWNAASDKLWREMEEDETAT